MLPALALALVLSAGFQPQETSPGATATHVTRQRSGLTSRCRGGCTDTALLRVLPGGVSPSLIAAGTLSGSKGQTITTTRASNKTCTRANGTVTYLSSNVPCVESAGLLVEGASTNVCLQSAALNSAPWGGANGTVTADTTVAPDGTTTADTVNDNATNSFHGINQSMTLSTSSAWTVSCSFKSTGNSTCVSVQFGSTGQQATFNMTTGALAGTTGGGISATSTQSLSNGFFRFGTSSTPSSATETIYILANPSCVTGATPTYVGSTQAMFIATACQVENQPVATSYIPTVGTSASRAADVVSVANPLTALAPFCVATTFTPQGTWAGAAAIDRRPLQFGGVSGTNSISMAMVGGSTYWVDYDGAAALKGVNFVYAPASGSHRFIGCKPTTSTYTATVDGVSMGSATGAGTGIASMPGTMYIGGNTSPAFGWLSDICVANAVGACQ